jgi:glucoside 3-dehydrogenase (cytochrome c) hitch-hiker subunit
MDRRDALQLIGGSAIAPLLAGLTPDRLHAAGRAIHARSPRPLQVLDPHQRETVATIAEMIIPETDTPGARTANVDAFADVLLAEWYDPPDRDRFLAGLTAIDERSRGLFGADFLGCTEPQRTAILAGLDAEVEALRAAKAKPNEHFFSRLKWLAVFGYFTSEVGMTQELHWRVIPGVYEPCVERP